MPCCWVRTALFLLCAVAAPAALALPLTEQELITGVHELTAYSQQWPMLWPVLLAAMAVLFVLFVIRGWRALQPRMGALDPVLWGLLVLGGALPALAVVFGQGRVETAWLSYLICAVAAVMVVLAMRQALQRWPGALILVLGALLALLGPSWHAWRGVADGEASWYFMLCAGWVLSQLVVGLPLAWRLESWAERTPLSPVATDAVPLPQESAVQAGWRDGAQALPPLHVSSVSSSVPAADTAPPVAGDSVMPEELAMPAVAAAPVISATSSTAMGESNPLYARIDAAIACAQAADEPLAVFCVRVVNAVDAARILGTNVVEEAMNELIRRLSARLPRRQQVLRLGVSNLIILHEDACDQASLEAVIEKVESVFAQPCEYSEGMLRLNAHVARTVLGVDGHDAATLVRTAQVQAAGKR